MISRNRDVPESGESSPEGILYVVATPIGHLDDVTRRALEVLNTVDLVLCEDTRRTRILLSCYDISVRCESFHEHNERRKIAGVIAQLQSGSQIALVSDAGTPLISDPGYQLVNACAEHGISIVPVPGASSITALLSVSGLPTDRFVFEGFLPPRSGKRSRRIAALTDEPRTIILFESPHRIARTLDALHDALGDRRACLGRELTKKFEEVRRGKLSELSEWANGRTVKGEIILAVAGVGSSKPGRS